MISLQEKGVLLRDLDPLACATLIIGIFIVAGVLHTFWLRSRYSLRFTYPLDGYRTFHGKRIFGENKTFRGFMMIIPATGILFFIFGLLHPIWPAWLSKGVWPLSPDRYGLLGVWAGIGFMLGELPNSFLKRQLGIPPGMAPKYRWGKPLCFLFDRLDSIVGMMFALNVMIPVPYLTWVYVLVIGPGIHWVFSSVLFMFKVKARHA